MVQPRSSYSYYSIGRPIPLNVYIGCPILSNIGYPIDGDYMSECDMAAKCDEPLITKIERLCWTSSCVDEDSSNYNPMKTVIV